MTEDNGTLTRAPLRISIVTPNYNGAAFIEETLKSVAGQGYPNVEFIVVDGASEDGSLDIIRRYEDRIVRLIVEPDGGHADAVNKGFRVATGDIMGWINSDDILHPGALDFIARLFAARPDIEWVTGRPTSMDESGRIEWMGPLRAWSRLRFLSGDNKWIQQESTFWRRSLWERAGGSLDLRYKVANDFDLWRRFFRHAELHSVDRCLGCFRVRFGQRSIKYKSVYETEMDAILGEELAAVEPEFRDALDGLLPKKVSRLEPVTEIAADRRYAIADPSFISYGDVLGWGSGEFRQLPRRALSLPVGRAGAPSDLSRFKDMHKGERCFIMGNGPSLNRMDLSKLAGETVFSCNGVFLLFERIAWRPKYYVCVDSRVLPDRAREISAMLGANPAMRAFFPAMLLEHVGEKRRQATRMILPPAHNRFYFNETPNSTDDLPHSMFSYDADDVVIQPFTVAITMLQLAAYMGFKEIVLIGCDTDYAVPSTAKRDPRGGVALTSRRDDDPNHFDRRYFGRNRKWHDPQPDKMIMHYAHAKTALDAIGVNVSNATVGGKLEVFPRRPYETFFAPSPSVGSSSVAMEIAREAKGRSGDDRGSGIGMRRALRQFGEIVRRSRGVVLVAVAAFFVLGVLAYVFRGSPVAPYVLGAGALLIAFGVLTAAVLKLRTFIVELSRQVLDIASGAIRPADGSVVARLETEDELARLREEVHNLKEEVASLRPRS